MEDEHYQCVGKKCHSNNRRCRSTENAHPPSKNPHESHLQKARKKATKMSDGHSCCVGKNRHVFVWVCRYKEIGRRSFWLPTRIFEFMTATLNASAKITIELYGPADPLRLAIIHHQIPHSSRTSSRGRQMNTASVLCMGSSPVVNNMHRLSTRDTQCSLRNTDRCSML